MDEDAQPLEVPIVAPIVKKKLETLEQEPVKTRYSNRGLACHVILLTFLTPTQRYSNEFLTTLMSNPELVRNVVLVGHLHQGKVQQGLRFRV